MAKKDYEVGYGRPPKETRFKKGRSGNPKGRPRGALNLDILLERELSETLSVTERGRKRQVTKREALIKTLIAKALGGDIRALSLLLEMTRKAETVSSKKRETQRRIEEDKRIIQEFLNDIQVGKSVVNGKEQKNEQ